ncbi:MAG: FecR domain-containing protein [Odoribacteraceae bacterium]|nr:FecR domain-containing protein [Odoribacteraceae bacterium]
MTHVKITGTAWKWLRDHSFTRRCLSGDASWEEFARANEGEREAIETARLVARQARLNDYRPARGDLERLWARVEESVRARRRSRRVFAVSAAVMFLSCCAAGVALLRGTLADAGDDYLLVGSAVEEAREIVLLTGNAGVIEVDNDALITCDAGGVTTSRRDGVEPRRVTVPRACPGNRLVVPLGRRAVVVLSDGTRAWVGPGSTLHFPLDFGTGERAVRAEGEVYVEVARDVARPFRVETPRLAVDATGTRFAVVARAGEEEHFVVLVEGSVRVSTGEESVALLPGQRLVVHGERRVVEEVDAREYISWKDGFLLFKGETMQEVLQRLGRYYNVSIACSRKVAGKRIAGKLVLFEEIERVMETFSLLYDVDCSVKSGTVVIDER